MNDSTVFFVVILPLFIFTLNIACLIIIFLHELSHALPAIYFSKQPATIYIGSYGDDTGPRFSIGKLTIVVKLRLLYLRAGGLCRHSPISSTSKNIIIIVAGPLGTAVTASLLFPLIFNTEIHGSIKLLIAILFAASLISLIINLYPHQLESDSTLYSDGYQLLNIIRLKSAIKYLFKAADLYERKEYRETLTELDKIDKKYLNEYIISIYTSCYALLHEYKKIKDFKEEFIRGPLLESLTSVNHTNIAFGYIQLKEYHESMVHLNQAILLNPEDYYNFNNRGFVLNILGDYNAAKADLDKACELEPEAAYAVTNRAHMLM